MELEYRYRDSFRCYVPKKKLVMISDTSFIGFKRRLIILSFRENICNVIKTFVIKVKTLFPRKGSFTFIRSDKI